LARKYKQNSKNAALYSLFNYNKHKGNEAG
jgi:hypothetical protein